MKINMNGEGDVSEQNREKKTEKEKRQTVVGLPRITFLRLPFSPHRAYDAARLAGSLNLILMGLFLSVNVFSFALL